MHRRTWIAAALAVAVFSVATACGSNSSSSSSGASGGGTIDVSGQSSTSMSAEDFSFTPSALGGTADQELTISLTNDGTTAHNFSIDDQDIDVTLQPGDQQDIDVTLPSSGSVQFYCSFHQASGMVGTLEVA